MTARCFGDFRVIATYGNLLLMITMLIILGVRIIPMPITRFQVIVAGVSKPKTKYLQNGAYIRLKDLTISYTIPKAWISTVGIEQLKVFASGQNLWVGTKLFKYLDPDIVSTRQSNSKDNKLVGNLTSDGKAYPFSRTFSFGINLTF